VRRKERKAQTRQELVDAAVTEFGRHGYQGGRVERIAAAAGVTTGALYAHFGSKEDLFLAVYEEAVGRTVDEASILTYQRAGSEPVDIAEAAEAWLAWHTADPRWIRLTAELVLSVADLPVLQPDVAGHRRAVRERVAVWLTDAAASQGRRLTVPAGELALHVHALAIGMVLEQIGDPSVASGGRFGRWVEAIVAQHTEPASDGTDPDPGPAQSRP
jgi:AcrR family transcriptional regulator